MQPLRKFWIEFIELYKSLPELWKRDSEQYGNKYLKKKAYELMLEKFREIDKEADIVAVKQRISNMRTAFWREVNRIRKSEQMALNPDDVYIPTLWYFRHMEFLLDEEGEPSTEAATTVEADEEEEIVPQQRVTKPPPKKRVFTMLPTTESEPPRNIRKDQASAHSAAWEALYRDLDSRQKLYANRIISEVLYQAALGKLQENSYKLLDMTVEDTHEETNHNTDGEFENQYYLTESTENDEYVIKKTNKRKFK
uniref:MADF domain-containing protein n=1 Tax=Stomoxys calcitrans TaxID=35570 RepID=A0A1I8PST2_STOCA